MGMNQIRQDLYGENGIGGIAKELEKLKMGDLTSLCEGSGVGSLGGGGSSSSSAQDDDAINSAARRRRTPDQDDLRQRLLERRSAQSVKHKSAVSFPQKLVLL